MYPRCVAFTHVTVIKNSCGPQQSSVCACSTAHDAIRIYLGSGCQGPGRSIGAWRAGARALVMGAAGGEDTYCRAARWWPTAQTSSRSGQAPHFWSSRPPATSWCCPARRQKGRFQLASLTVDRLAHEFFFPNIKTHWRGNFENLPGCHYEMQNITHLVYKDKC